MIRAIKWILVLMVIAGGGWLVWYSGWLNMSPGTVATTSGTATSIAPAPAPVPLDMNGMSDAKDAGDSALTQDTAAIDAQMQGLTQDSASLDATLNDKPTPQATNI